MGATRCRHCAKLVKHPKGASCPHCGKRLRPVGCLGRFLRVVLVVLLLAIAIPVAMEMLRESADETPDERPPPPAPVVARLARPSSPAPAVLPPSRPSPAPDLSPADAAERVIDGDSGFASIRESLVLIRTEGGGSGSGFVVEMNGTKWVLTNIHVVLGGPVRSLRTSDGQMIDVGKVEFARARDLARFALVAPDLPALKVSTRLPVIGEKIIAYGKSQGEAVVTQLEGAIRSVGPDEIEVTAEVVGGNSGCPIIGPDGLVQAVVYQARRPSVPETVDWTILDTRFVETRRYALRLDTPTDWVPINSERFYAQVALLSDIGAYMDDIAPVFYHFHTRSRDHVWLSDNTADYSYVNHRYEGLLGDFYARYNKLVDALKSIEESSKNVRSATIDSVVRDEQRRMNLYRTVRRQRAKEAGNAARNLCRVPIMILRQGVGRWEVAFLERYADQQHKVLVFLNEQLAVLADSFEQREGWD